ncbi:unnamed protein product [Parnassius mnemosyne]|uniref:Mutant cadherin n=1 Tax=Parnassius mnemosyne TaxID=213953 RepID=A0AAV1LJ37_9NEOP
MASYTVKCNNCNIVISELLAFIQNKADVMDEESIIRLCTSSFSSEEVVQAKNLLFESITTTSRKITRKKEGKMQRDIEDIISVIKRTDPEKMPIFVAKDLQKLPPFTFDHVDATRLLKDIISLKNDMKIIKEKYVTLEMLEERVPFLEKNQNIDKRRRGYLLNNSLNVDSGPIGLTHIHSESTTATSEVNELARSDKDLPVLFSRDIPVSLAPVSVHRCEESSPVSSGAQLEARTVVATNVANCANTATSALTHSEPTPISGNGANKKDVTAMSSGRKRFSDVVREGGQWKPEAPKDEWILLQRRRLRNRFMAKKGKADLEVDCGFKAADVKIPFYIYNVDKNACVDDISKYIMSKTSVEVALERVNMRQKKEYEAYKFLIPKHKLSVFMDENIWPQGVSFRRFVTFNKRNDKNDNAPRRDSER